MYKTLPVIAVGTLLFLGVAGTSFAADAAAKQPLDQAKESIDKNLVKDPDNKGLNNAAEQLQTNQERIQEKRQAQSTKRLSKRDKLAEKKSDREKSAHVDKVERPEKAERPEKIERPERTERPEKPARP